MHSHLCTNLNYPSPMSRLASFRGPSTPSASPVAQVKQPNSPLSLSKIAESPFHRKLRTYLQELRKLTETWDDIVCIDGAKAAKTLIDARTNLDNHLALVPPDQQPQSRVVGPQIRLMEKSIFELDYIIQKLHKQFRKINAVIDNMESLLCEAHKTKGWKWVQEEPLWVTWPMDKFVTSIPELLRPYHRSLNMHIEIVDLLRCHSVSFDASRDALSKWLAQPWLEEDGWEARWEDLCAVEVHRWSGA